LLDCNLESARFYALRPLQRFRIKRWDYYAVFTPRRFFLRHHRRPGLRRQYLRLYAGLRDRQPARARTGHPAWNGIELPRNSTQGDSHFEDKRVNLGFSLHPDKRHLSVSWPDFHDGRGIQPRLTCLRRQDTSR
jgi:hypothetical protein